MKGKFAPGRKRPPTSNIREMYGRRKPPKAEHILAAATTVFLRDGYDAGSMDSVAQQARTSKGTIYAHFDGKDGLFMAVVSRECQRCSQLFDQGDDEHLSFVATLLKFGKLYVDVLTQPEVVKLQRLVVSVAHRFPAIGPLFYDASRQHVQQELSKSVSRALLSSELIGLDTDTVADFFLSMLRGSIPLCAEFCFPPPSQDTKDKIIRAAANLVASAYASP